MHKAQITINSFSILKLRDLPSILHMYRFILILSLNPGDHPKPGIEPRSPAWQVDSLPAEPQGKPNCSIKPMACDDLEKEAVIIVEPNNLLGSINK